MKKIFTLLCFILSACCFGTTTDKVIFDQPLMDGQLAYGRIAPMNKVFIADSERRVGGQDGLFEIPTKEGCFVVGIPQDATKLSLVLKTKTGFEKYHFPVQKRLWKEDVVNGLSPKKVQPPQEEQKRILAESLLMRDKRKTSELLKFVQTWHLPVETYTRISSPFGARRLLNGVVTQGHSGTDYAAPEGTPVLAAADGKVVLVHPDMFYTGGTILLDHGYGIFTTYCHLSRIDVKAGQRVKAGEAIAAVGSTGRVTGPHLHFGLTWYGVRLNPEDLFFNK